MAKLLKNLLKKLKLNESTVSMVLGFLVVIVVGTLVFNYFRNIRRPTTAPGEKIEEETSVKLGELPTTYTVKKGDNLWKIAENFYDSGYNWVDIAKENNLANPDILLADQELTIPKAEVIKPKFASGETEFGSTIESDSYAVVKGDHLWGIAVRAYGDGYQWVKIARENNLANPNLIHAGNILKIPR